MKLKTRYLEVDANIRSTLEAWRLNLIKTANQSYTELKEILSSKVYSQQDG